MKTAIGYKLFRVSKKYPGKLFPRRRNESNQGIKRSGSQRNL